jgi:hypothetical protein
MPEKKVYNVKIEIQAIFPTEAESEEEAIIATQKWLDNYEDFNPAEMKDLLDNRNITIVK